MLKAELEPGHWVNSFGQVGHSSLTQFLSFSMCIYCSTAYSK